MFGPGLHRSESAYEEEQSTGSADGRGTGVGGSSNLFDGGEGAAAEGGKG